ELSQLAKPAGFTQSLIGFDSPPRRSGLTDNSATRSLALLALQSAGRSPRRLVSHPRRPAKSCPWETRHCFTSRTPRRRGNLQHERPQHDRRNPRSLSDLPKTIHELVAELKKQQADRATIR